ncbi:MAG: exonuclease [Oligoflexia bacterium]|nr:exonuclease [Oligoflexia bacterium]
MNKNWRDCVFVGFDTETSGKYPLTAEIVEVAGAKWKNGQIIERFQALVKPVRPMGEQVIAIHGITNEMVADAPSIGEVIGPFLKFMGDGIPVAHHAAFDMGFLAPEIERAGLSLPTGPVLDTCFLGQRVIPKLFNYRLATLVKELKVPQERAHRALDDAEACLGVALELMKKLGDDKTIGEVFAAQESVFEWERFSLKKLVTQSETYSVLVEASQKQLAIEFKYEGGSTPGEPRRMTPQGIVRTPQGDYVVGLCHREHREKRFYVNRISSAVILD